MTDSERCKVGYEMLPFTSSGINLLIADAPVIATRACAGLELYQLWQSCSRSISYCATLWPPCSI